MNPNEEQAYEQGSRTAWTQMLRKCLKHLDQETVNVAAWITEREEAIAMLRTVCREFGDNDWPEDLHLADIIEKHLFEHLHDREESIYNNLNCLGSGRPCYKILVNKIISLNTTSGHCECVSCTMWRKWYQSK